jgi:hypothetical protein
MNSKITMLTIKSQSSFKCHHYCLDVTSKTRIIPVLRVRTFKCQLAIEVSALMNGSIPSSQNGLVVVLL